MQHYHWVSHVIILIVQQSYFQICTFLAQFWDTAKPFFPCIQYLCLPTRIPFIRFLMYRQAIYFVLFNFIHRRNALLQDWNNIAQCCYNLVKILQFHISRTSLQDRIVIIYCKTAILLKRNMQVVNYILYDLAYLHCYKVYLRV